MRDTKAIKLFHDMTMQVDGERNAVRWWYFWKHGYGSGSTLFFANC